jgi:hypothetical protein
MNMVKFILEFTKFVVVGERVSGDFITQAKYKYVFYTSSDSRIMMLG